jgi:hypothetical protein
VVGAEVAEAHPHLVVGVPVGADEAIVLHATAQLHGCLLEVSDLNQVVHVRLAVLYDVDVGRC